MAPSAESSITSTDRCSPFIEVLLVPFKFGFDRLVSGESWPRACSAVLLVPTTLGFARNLSLGPLGPSSSDPTADFRFRGIGEVAESLLGTAEMSRPLIGLSSKTVVLC